MLVLIQPDLREALGKAVEEAPVGSRLLAIEQAGLGQPEHATGLGAQYRAAGMLFTQPWEHLWITLQQVVEVVPVGREDDDVGVVQATVDRKLHIAEAVHRLAVGAHQADLEHGLQAQA